MNTAPTNKPRALLERQETANALALLRAALEASGAGILAVDIEGTVTVYNQLLLDMWGISAETLQSSDRRQRVAMTAGKAKDSDYAAQRIGEVYADPEREFVESFELTDGSCIEITSLPQRLEDGNVIGRVWSFRDVTYQRRIEQELRELSIRDALTGMFNRRRAEETLATEVARARRTKQTFSVAMLDIDHFKRVNDTHGHQVGDDVLRQLAVDVRKLLRATDIACRWGGEEFLLILPDTDAAGAFEVVDRLRAYLGRERKTLPNFTVSAGVAEHESDDKRWDAVVKAADERLYEAKQAGRNRVFR